MIRCIQINIVNKLHVFLTNLRPQTLNIYFLTERMEHNHKVQHSNSEDLLETFCITMLSIDDD